MQTPLNASASTAGALLSGSTFEIPQFQREYSWTRDEVGDFWTDLKNSLDSDSYFLGLVILTDENERKYVVDGQQRLITISLLSAALYYESVRLGRSALADRIQATFLRTIDYDSDETLPRIKLADKADDETYQTIINSGEPPTLFADPDSVSASIVDSYVQIRRWLQADLKQDPFKRLGKWTEFLTHKVYFAVFVHPNPSTAYQVYEVINTRGKELTTADLLKNFILYQTPPNERAARYHHWKSISGQFSAEGSNNFVQYIRHAVTVRSGHVLPKDLYDFLSERVGHPGKRPPSPEELMVLLDKHLPLYLQMIDPALGGPAEPEALRIFSALNSLGVLSVRPILLAIADVPDPIAGMRYVLKLVVRRIVVGNLGTGNVERRFGEAAKKISDRGDWRVIVDDLKDLNPSQQDFIDQLRKRSFNKGVLSFVRRSIIAEDITPVADGVLHFIWTRQATDWEHMTEEDGSFWASTIGNTLLVDRRHSPASDWDEFKEYTLPSAVPGEIGDVLEAIDEWDAGAVEAIGKALAESAGEIWYRQD